MGVEVNLHLGILENKINVFNLHSPAEVTTLSLLHVKVNKAPTYCDLFSYTSFESIVNF